MKDFDFNDYEMYLIKDTVLYYAALHSSDESYVSIAKRLIDYCNSL